MPYYKYLNKNIYYNEIGSGIPLLFLHGNTASSKMFDSIINLYKEDYKVILIDFLGHGKSDRLSSFNPDLWYEEAQQVIKLLEEKSYNNVNIIGSSGGALVAINVALERPDLVNKIIADSFEGEKSLESFANNIKQARQLSKENKYAIEFYKHNHGEDWENVVDNDTEAIFKHYTNIKDFFHKPLDTLKPKILLTGSEEDEFVPTSFYNQTFNKLAQKIEYCEIHLFNKGSHPAILSNSTKFSIIAKEFLIMES